MLFTFQAFITKDPKALIKGFKSYILPILNYCSPVWSPCLVGDIILVESVQRNFTKKLPGYQNMTYSNRLNALNLPTLELRRLHTDLTLCYKIVNGYVASPPENFGLLLSTRQSRGH